MKEERTGGEVGDQTGGNAGGGDDNAGGGGASDPLSRRQFLAELSTSQVDASAPAEGELTPEQVKEIQEITKQRVEDITMDFEDMFPEATRSQQQAYVRAAMEDDHAAMMKVTQDANKTTMEKDEQDRRKNAGDLNIQRTGSGKEGETSRPNSMRGAMAAAAANIRST